MSRIIPPLLRGFAYSRVVRWGSLEVDLNTTGVPRRPSSTLRLAAA
jgi:hypothetical protein